MEGLELEQQGSMILKPPDDSSGSMCLGNPPSYSAFVLGLAFTLCFSGGETWTDERRETAVEVGTDGGQGGVRRGVRTSTCRSAGPCGEAKTKGGYTHTLTHVLVCFKDHGSLVKSPCERPCENAVN